MGITLVITILGTLVVGGIIYAAACIAIEVASFFMRNQ